MAANSANVTSLDVVRQVRGALVQFEADMQDALTMFDLEARRPVEWIDNDRAKYWPREERASSDAVIEAKLALERAETSAVSDETKYCYDERKSLEKAKRRRQRAEEKLQAVKRWQPQIRKEVEEFQVQLAKARQYLETDFPRALAALERMATALDQYVQMARPESSSAEGT
jgi:transposase